MLVEDSKKRKLTQLFSQLRDQELIRNPLFQALAQIPRELFIPRSLQHYAYDNLLLPIECGSYVERLDEQVAILHALDLGLQHRVLEIGTGSGYSSALISQMAARVTTVERYATLVENAAFCHRELGLNNLIIEHADALDILNKSPSYDRILIWPSFSSVPRRIIDLLAIGGKLIVPVGAPYSLQQIQLYHRWEERFEQQTLFNVAFQPLITEKGLCL